MRLISKLYMKYEGYHLSLPVNPLTTDDECTRHATLAACYQLAQSVLKIGFALAKKVG